MPFFSGDQKKRTCNMKLLFITFSPLSSNAGHIARLKLELSSLEKMCEVSIMCLGKNSDDKATQEKYSNTTFIHNPISFDGWNVVNLDSVVSAVVQGADKINADAIILQMEVWDLMRELGVAFSGKRRFAVVVHAMPFVVSPVNPTGNFEKDVIAYADSELPNFRKEYILQHYKEAREVLGRIIVIANNKTVAYYFKTYFKNVNIHTMVPSLVAQVQNASIRNKGAQYDFVYMARMERGKGIEYFHKILPIISNLLGRRVSLLVLGRADDETSRTALAELCTRESSVFAVEFKGWASDNEKKELLPKCGVFLYPSHYDNYPTVLNEALGFGLPCVTWDVLFAKINYSETDAVKKIPLFNFEQFAQVSVWALNNKNDLTKEAYEFANSFPDANEVAQLDFEVFAQL
jgi:glycosyltransferase involved in cell wall biosynthesis